MAQSSEFPLRKPPGFHWDFFLLGITTFIAGLLGLPAPNGLIPQAPIHTTSLLVMSRHPVKERDIEKSTEQQSQSQTHISNIERDGAAVKEHAPPPNTMIIEFPVAVIEQRVSNLAQGSLCLVLLTGPFLHLLNLIPRGTALLKSFDLCI